MIEFKNVSIQYIKDFYALLNKNFTFASNTLILGDSVVGSSAIMRIISKIDKDYSGDVLINSVNLKDINDKNLPIAYSPEKPELFKCRSIFLTFATL